MVKIKKKMWIFPLFVLLFGLTPVSVSNYVIDGDFSLSYLDDDLTAYWPLLSSSESHGDGSGGGYDEYYDGSRKYAGVSATNRLWEFAQDVISAPVSDFDKSGSFELVYKVLEGSSSGQFGVFFTDTNNNRLYLTLGSGSSGESNNVYYLIIDSSITEDQWNTKYYNIYDVWVSSAGFSSSSQIDQTGFFVDTYSSSQINVYFDRIYIETTGGGGCCFYLDP